MTDNSKAFEGIALNDEDPSDGRGHDRHYADGFYGATVAEVIANFDAHPDEATVSMVVVESGTNNVAATWVRGVGWFVTADFAGAQGAGFVR